MIKQIEFNNIKASAGNLCVSIYIPTEITGQYDQNRIRWKNACHKALNILEKEYNENASMLQPGLDLIKDNKFWAYQSSGLAGFFTKGYYKLIQLTHPIKNDFLHVHDHFYLSPLLNEISNELRVFILKISKNETAFYEAVEDGIYPVYIDDVIAGNMAEALNIDEFRNTLQFRSIGGGRAVFHGSGVDNNLSDDLLIEYFRKIDKGILSIIQDEKVPLVLATVEENWSKYANITNYKYFSKHMIAGNTEALSPQVLRENVQPVFDEMKKQKIQAFQEEYALKQSKHLTVDAFDEVLEMARYKNIDSILISDSCMKYLATKEPEKYEIMMMEIYKNNGKINFIESEERALKAILRFNMEVNN